MSAELSRPGRHPDLVCAVASVGQERCHDKDSHPRRVSRIPHYGPLEGRSSAHVYSHGPDHAAGGCMAGKKRMDSSFGEQDRDAILRRRHRFVAMAVAGLASTTGCGEPAHRRPQMPRGGSASQPASEARDPAGEQEDPADYEFQPQVCLQVPPPDESTGAEPRPGADSEAGVDPEAAPAVDPLPRVCLSDDIIHGDF